MAERGGNGKMGEAVRRPRKARAARIRAQGSAAARGEEPDDLVDRNALEDTPSEGIQREQRRDNW